MPSQNNTVRPILRTWAVCIFLFAGTALLFSRALNYGFSKYDDPGYVSRNPHVQADLSWNSVVWAFTSPSDYWHPLTWLSHMLDWQLYGSDAFGHHATSVVWHAINAVLVFFVLRRLSGAYWASAFGAALFAWHPLRVESVVWITERKDVMSGCFFLLSVWAYTAYAARRKERQPAAKYYGLTLLLFFCGLMSKPMLVTLPVILLLLDYWPLGRLPAVSKGDAKATSLGAWRGWFPLVLEKIPFFVLSLVISVVTVRMQHGAEAFVLKLDFAARIENAFVAIARYLGKFFWPFDLAVCYPHPGYWPTVSVIGAILLVAVVSTVGWWQRKTRPSFLIGWLWFLVMLLPAIGLIQVGFQSMADRYSYLSLLGVQLALMGQLPDRIKSPVFGRLLPVLGAIVLLGCAMRSWNQESTWRNSISLFEQAVAVTERNDVAEALLSYSLFEAGRIDEAAQHSERALEYNPRNRAALHTLANIRAQQGRFEEGVTLARTLLQMKPEDTQSEYLLGALLLGSGSKDEAVLHLTWAMRRRPDLLSINLNQAIADTQNGRAQTAVGRYEAALALNPDDASTHFGLGLAYGKLGRVDEALAQFNASLKLQPDYSFAHQEIAQILLSRNAPEEAAAHFRAVLQSQPKYGAAHLGLARAEEQLGRTAAADASFAQAIAVAPHDPDVLYAWADTLARRGRFAEAAAPYEQAVRARPNDASMRAGFGFVLLLSDRRAEAIVQWEEALRLAPNFPGLRERLEKIRSQGGN